MSQQLEREAIRDQLFLCREQQELVEEDDLEKVEKGEREMMDLLSYYISLRGKVLAVPVYRSNVETGTVALRKSAIAELVYINPNMPGTKDKRGVTRILVHHFSPIIDDNEDPAVWKWGFADLADDEDLNTIIHQKERWGWARMALGPELSRGQNDFADDASVTGLVELQ